MSRAFQIISYFVASAILATAYTSAINTKNHGLATAIAVGETGLTALASLAWFREARAANSAHQALTELQGRIVERPIMPSMSIATPQKRNTAMAHHRGNRVRAVSLA